MSFPTMWHFEAAHMFLAFYANCLQSSLLSLLLYCFFFRLMQWQKKINPSL